MSEPPTASLIVIEAAELDDLAGVLAAVLGAVVVGVRVAGVEAGADLGAVAEVVAVVVLAAVARPSWSESFLRGFVCARYSP